MKPLSKVLEDIQEQLNQDNKNSNTSLTLINGSKKSAGQSITVSSLETRQMPLSKDQEKAIRSLWVQKSQCVELWKPIILEGKTRYSSEDYIYVYKGDIESLEKTITASLRPASDAAKIKALTVLAIHRPMKEVSNERTAFLIEDYSDSIGEVSEMALLDAVDILKENPGDETERWFPMIGEIKRAIAREQKKLSLLSNAENREVPEGYMRAGYLNFKAREIAFYDGFHEQTYEEYLAIE